MPPKEKVSKKQILDTAFAMTKENGFEALTARKLAEQLNTSTQPIFRAYENMEMLKEDLYFESAAFFSEYMLSKRNESEPDYLAMGMAYIDLAMKEKKLFRLIADIEEHAADELSEFLQNGENMDLLSNLPKTETLSETQKRDVFRMVWMFTHGVATLVTGNRVVLSRDEIRGMLERAYEGFVLVQG